MRAFQLPLSGLLLLVGCGGDDTSAIQAEPSALVRRPQLELAAGQELAPPSVRPMWTTEDLPQLFPAWTTEGRELVLGRGESAGALRAPETQAKRQGRGDDLRLTIPGPFNTRDFNQLALTGTFPDVYEVWFQLKDDAKPIQLTTRKQATPQTLLFDLESVHGRNIPVTELRFLIKGPAQAFQLEGLDLVRIPDHMLLPSLGSEPELVHQGTQSRPAYGLPPEVVATTTFTVGHASERISFATTIPTNFRPGPGQPRLEIELRGEGEPDETTVALADDGAAWHPTTIPLETFVGQRVTARFVYRCDHRRKGMCALADLRVWRPTDSPATTLLISSDTHRADHVAVSDLGVTLDTPVLDELATSGLLFEDAWATTNVTSPSHVAMLTGRHPRDTRLVSNQDRLVEEAHTVAEAFRDAGWRTLCAVSVRHLGPRGTNIGQGFDQIYSPLSDTPRAEVPIAVLRHWIEEADGSPVFAFLHLFDAHHPYQPPASHDRRYYPAGRDPFDPTEPAIDARRGSLPADYWGRLRDVEFPKAQYRAEVTYLDGALGKLVELPRVRDGLIAFTSDHGEILEKAGTYFNHGELFPDTLHVPLILSGGALPEEFRARRFQGPISQLGLPRTLLDLSDLGHLDFPGDNLLAQVEAGDGAEALFALSAHGKSASIRSEGWFLVLHLADHHSTLPEPRKQHQIELFDLNGDPDCLVDRSAQEPQRAAALRGRLVAWLQAADMSGLSRPRTSTAQELEELAALGYATAEETLSESKPWYTPPGPDRSE